MIFTIASIPFRRTILIALIESFLLCGSEGASWHLDLDGFQLCMFSAVLHTRGSSKCYGKLSGPSGLILRWQPEAFRGSMSGVVWNGYCGWGMFIRPHRTPIAAAAILCIMIINIINANLKWRGLNFMHLSVSQADSRIQLSSQSQLWKMWATNRCQTGSKDPCQLECMIGF